MNKSQYKRLCLVLVVPLLIAGFISSNTFLKYEKSQSLLCEKFLGTGPEICRRASFEDRAFYDMVKKDSEAWASVEMPSEDRSVKLYVEAARRPLYAQQIIDTIPILGYEKKAAYMDQMIGRAGLIVLGIKKNETYPVKEDLVLACNRLQMDHKEQGIYEVACYGNEWAGIFTFKPTAETEAMLQELRNEYVKELDEYESGYWINKIAATLLYVVLFVIISLLVYLARAGFNYVRFGSKKGKSAPEVAGT